MKPREKSGEFLGYDQESVQVQEKEKDQDQEKDGPRLRLPRSREAYLPVALNLNTVGALREGHPIF